MVRLSKIILAAATALFGLHGVFNFLNWDRTTSAVREIASMAGVPGGADMPFATTNPLIIFLGALMIGGCKVSGGVFLSIGTVKMIQARKGPPSEFEAAKAWAIAGCAILTFLFAVGFLFIANSIFFAWQTEVGRMATNLATQFGVMVGIIMLYLGQREPESEGA